MKSYKIKALIHKLLKTEHQIERIEKYLQSLYDSHTNEWKESEKGDLLDQRISTLIDSRCMVEDARVHMEIGFEIDSEGKP